MSRSIVLSWFVALALCSCRSTANGRATSQPANAVLEDYLAAVHRRLHEPFVDGFLEEIAESNAPASFDPWVATRLEIVVNRDGSLHRVGLVSPSQSEAFSRSTHEAVMRAAPFAAPPETALSGDGRVYLHWSFHRNQMQCGTYHTELYVLREPPPSKAEPNTLQPNPLVPLGTIAAVGPNTRPRGHLDPTKLVGRSPAALEEVCDNQAGRYRSRERRSSCWIADQGASVIAEYSADLAEQVRCTWSKDLTQFTLRTFLLSRFGTPDQAGHRNGCFFMAWRTAELEIGYAECGGPPPSITWWAATARESPG